MEEKDFERYLKDRYYDQIEWYSEKARFNKRWYQIIQLLTIIVSALIPAIVCFGGESFEWIPAVLSIFIAILTGALNLFKFQENWANYRTTAENLKKEKWYFDARVGEYAYVEDPKALFVERVESLISKEHSDWLRKQKPKNIET